MPIRKGDKVFDKVTYEVATVLDIRKSKDNDEGKWWMFYKLDVPSTADYPDGWRHQGEISTAKRHFK